MLNPRYKKRLENLRKIDAFYKNLAAGYEVNDPLVRTAMNKKATIVYYLVYKEYEQAEKLIHDRFADIYGHTGEILYYRRPLKDGSEEYFTSDFKNKVIPPRFTAEIDAYINEILELLGLTSDY